MTDASDGPDLPGESASPARGTALATGLPDRAAALSARAKDLHDQLDDLRRDALRAEPSPNQWDAVDDLTDARQAATNLRVHLANAHAGLRAPEVAR